MNENFTKKKKYSLIDIFNLIIMGYHKNDIFSQKSKQFLLKLVAKIYFIIVFFCVTFSVATILIDFESKFSLKVLVGTLQIFIFFVLLTDLGLTFFSYPARSKNRNYKKLWLVYLECFLTARFWITFISVLPSLYIVDILSNQDSSSFLLFMKKLTILRVFRIFILLTIFKPFRIFISCFRNQKVILLNILFFILVTTFLLSVFIYDSEKKYNSNIKSYWDALYFTIITITTIGYGDISPTSNLAKILVVSASFLGIAFFVIPSSIVASAFLQEIDKEYQKKEADQKDLDKELNMKKEIDFPEKYGFLKAKIDFEQMFPQQIPFDYPTPHFNIKCFTTDRFYSANINVRSKNQAFPELKIFATTDFVNDIQNKEPFLAALKINPGHYEISKSKNLALQLDYLRGKYFPLEKLKIIESKENFEVVEIYQLLNSQLQKAKKYGWFVGFWGMFYHNRKNYRDIFGIHDIHMNQGVPHGFNNHVFQDGAFILMSENKIEFLMFFAFENQCLETNLKGNCLN